MARLQGFECGMGLGGWLTNYKRMGQLPPEKRTDITRGDEAHFDTYITEADIAYIRELGFDHIRLGFDQMVVEEYTRPGVWRESGWRHIDDCIGWCERHGLSVMLNLHKAIGAYCEFETVEDLYNTPALSDRFVALWLYAEERYHDHPTVAFELMNEVKDGKDEAWNALAARTVAALREKNADRLIVVGSSCWNSCHTLRALRVFDDPRVVYTFHMYEPFLFTHQRGVLQPSAHYYNQQLTYPFRTEDYPERHLDGYGPTIDAHFIRAAMDDAVKFVEAHPDKVLYCGEFGTIRHADITSRENYMRDVIAVCREYGMPYCVWNYLSTPYDGNRFSLVDDDHRRILSPRLHRILLGAAD